MPYSCMEWGCRGLNRLRVSIEADCWCKAVLLSVPQWLGVLREIRGAEKMQCCDKLWGSAQQKTQPMWLGLDSGIAWL